MKRLVGTFLAIAMAISMPVLAQGNGKGNDNTNGNRGGPPAQAGQSDRGNGNGNGNGNAGRGNADRGDGPAMSDARGNRPGPPPQAQGNAGSASGNTGNGNVDRAGPPPGRGNNANNGYAYRGSGNQGPPAAGGNRSGARSIDRYEEPPVLDFRRVSSHMAEGCPPGLAKKYNGCRPPGLARQQDRYRYARYAPDWWGFGGLFGDRGGNYFYDEGFLLRFSDGGGISGYIPLLGGALSVGNLWPDEYRYSNMPAYYESYYGLGDRNRYRYADNVVYRMDPDTATITSIAALLTGDEFVVGQRMPRGYDIYNVPYSYRDRYYDRPGAMYRYNDGYVYEIDPETMLVASAIELLI